jgi:hypothetical protein
LCNAFGDSCSDAIIEILVENAVRWSLGSGYNVLEGDIFCVHALVSKYGRHDLAAQAFSKPDDTIARAGRDFVDDLDDKSAFLSRISRRNRKMYLCGVQESTECLAVSLNLNFELLKKVSILDMFPCCRQMLCSDEVYCGTECRWCARSEHERRTK